MIWIVAILCSDGCGAVRTQAFSTIPTRLSILRPVCHMGFASLSIRQGDSIIAMRCTSIAYRKSALESFYIQFRSRDCIFESTLFLGLAIL